LPGFFFRLFGFLKGV